MSHNAPAIAALPHPLAGGVLTRALRGAMQRLRHAYQVRATRDALEKLSDRELQDIGVTRRDIDRISETVAL